MLTIPAAIARIVTNPFSNVLQKQLTQRSADPLFIIAATYALLTVIALPLLLGEPLRGLGLIFWTNMLTAIVLVVSGNSILVYALRSADLSVLGPINAYKAVLSLVLAVVLIGEVPTLFGLLGVRLIVGGSFLVIDRVPGKRAAARSDSSFASRAFNCDSVHSSAPRLRRCSSSARCSCRRRSPRSSCGWSWAVQSPRSPKGCCYEVGSRRRWCISGASGAPTDGWLSPPR